MIKSLPFYLISSILSVLIFYAGLTDKKLPLIASPRSAVIALTILGFLMCTFGTIGFFINKGLTHPLTIAGYVLGILALAIGVVQLFNIKAPAVSNPHTALILLAVLIALKVIIARLYFLLPVLKK